MIAQHVLNLLSGPCPPHPPQKLVQAYLTCHQIYCTATHCCTAILYVFFSLWNILCTLIWNDLISSLGLAPHRIHFPLTPKHQHKYLALLKHRGESHWRLTYQMLFQVATKSCDRILPARLISGRPMRSFKQHVGLMNKAKCVLHCKFDYYFLK